MAENSSVFRFLQVCKMCSQCSDVSLPSLSRFITELIVIT